MPQTLDVQTVFIIIAIALIMGWILAYLFLSIGRVKKSLYQKLKGELALQENLNKQQESKLTHLETKMSLLNENAEKERDINQSQQASLQRNQEQIIALNKELAGVSADNRSLLDKLDAQMEHFQEMKATSKLEFAALANQMLEEKSKQFDEQNKKGIAEVLSPLKEKIKSFEEKVEVTNKESIARHSSLKEQISGLRSLNEKMSQEAINLTNALKQDTKAQGNWGELILESILEKSGLVKDREFFIQRSLKNDGGKTLRPDVIIELPKNKKIIIDSKVSLKAYEQIINADDESNQNAALKAHLSSIKNHIDGLASKNYHNLYQIDSPDFVLMFVPIETAFSIAINKDKDLYAYAFNKNIVIVTPSTLLATLKTVESLWQNEKQQKYALEIATEAGKMYDKFVNFVSDLETIGQRINQSQSAYQDTIKKLQTGNGNLISKAEKIKSLGAKTTKSLGG